MTEAGRSRTRYRFQHRAGDTYYWQSTQVLPRDSRVEQIRCPVNWFWSKPTAAARSQR